MLSLINQNGLQKVSPFPLNFIFFFVGRAIEMEEEEYLRVL